LRFAGPASLPEKPHGRELSRATNAADLGASSLPEEAQRWRIIESRPRTRVRDITTLRRAGPSQRTDCPKYPAVHARRQGGRSRVATLAIPQDIVVLGSAPGRLLTDPAPSACRSRATMPIRARAVVRSGGRASAGPPGARVRPARRRCPPPWPRLREPPHPRRPRVPSRRGPSRGPATAPLRPSLDREPAPAQDDSGSASDPEANHTRRAGPGCQVRRHGRPDLAGRPLPAPAEVAGGGVNHSYSPAHRCRPRATRAAWCGWDIRPSGSEQHGVHTGRGAEKRGARLANVNGAVAT
jgi:hypothetical protein